MDVGSGEIIGWEGGTSELQAAREDTVNAAATLFSAKPPNLLKERFGLTLIISGSVALIDSELAIALITLGYYHNLGFEVNFPNLSEKGKKITMSACEKKRIFSLLFLFFCFSHLLYLVFQKQEY